MQLLLEPFDKWEFFQEAVGIVFGWMSLLLQLEPQAHPYLPEGQVHDGFCQLTDVIHDQHLDQHCDLGHALIAKDVSESAAAAHP